MLAKFQELICIPYISIKVNHGCKLLTNAKRNKQNIWTGRCCCAQRWISTYIAPSRPTHESFFTSWPRGSEAHCPLRIGQ